MQTGNNYQISIQKKPHHDVYFTDEIGYSFLLKKDGVALQFNDLPTPLLKQIK
jgi:hypothetical protein